MNEDQNSVFAEPTNTQNPSGNTANPSQNSSADGSNNLENRLDHLMHPESSNDGQTQQNVQQTTPQQPIVTQTPPPQPQDAPVYSNPVATTTPAAQPNPNQYNTDDSPFDIGGVQEQPQVQKTTNKDKVRQPNPAIEKAQNQIIAFLSTRWWVVVIVVLLVSILSATAFFFINQPEEFSASDFTNVVGTIDGPATSPSGSPATWKIQISNQESVAIKDIEINLDFDRTFQYLKPISPDPSNPDGSQYRFSELAGIGQGTSTRIIQFEGVLTGNIDEQTLMNGTISYTPAPLEGATNARRTVAIAEEATKITAPEVNVSLTPANDSVQNGGEVELIATFENLSERDLNNIRITMEYPSGSNFTYTSSELRLRNADLQTVPSNSNNIWDISTLPRLQSSTLQVKGNLLGADGVRETFRIIISAQDPSGNYETLSTDVAEILVTSQPLIISTRIEGKDATRTFGPGDSLTFVIDYQNKSNNTIQNVELFGFVDDPANLLDYSTLSFVGGDIGNLNNRVITWRGSGVPQLVTLTPQVSGTVRYSIKVKSGDNFIASSLNQSSYTIRPRAQALATNIQQFEVGGELYQGEGEITFNQTATTQEKDDNQANRRLVTIDWEIRTRQNAVNDVIVETISPLPPTAWQQTSINPSSNSGEISYDPLTGKITWVPGNISAYTGISGPVKRISFDLEVVVPENSSLNQIQLLDRLTLTGVDDFTGERYEISNSATNAKE